VTFRREVDTGVVVEEVRTAAVGEDEGVATMVEEDEDGAIEEVGVALPIIRIEEIVIDEVGVVEIDLRPTQRISKIPRWPSFSNSCRWSTKWGPFRR